MEHRAQEDLVVMQLNRNFQLSPVSPSGSGKWAQTVRKTKLEANFIGWEQ